jgi:branched-chain amino acid transport system permease protein
MFGYLLISGLTTGGLYAMVAIGLVVVFRATGHMNFAHGELFMIAGCIAYSLIVQFHLPTIPSLLLAVFFTFLLGILTDRLVYRRLTSAHSTSLVLATVGLSFLLKGISRAIWGGRGEYLTIPPLLDPAPIFLAGIPVLPQQLVILFASLASLAAFLLFFRLTRAGKMMQAVAEVPLAAYLVGIRVERVYAWTWGAGAAAAGVAGVLMAPLTLLTPDIGFALLLKAFAATVLGGLGSMLGAIVGGFCVGLIEAFAGGYVDTSLQDVSAFVIIMLVLVIRPRGLFGAPLHRPA